MMHFHAPGNPLDGWLDLPFRAAWTRHTAAGVTCYFCRSVVDDDSGSFVPCCQAADYWAGEMRKRTAKWLVSKAIRRLP